MHSGFEIPGIQHQQHQQAAESSCPPLLLSMNPTHILDQIHSLPSTHQQVPLDHHHFLPPHHHYPTGAAPYFPLNFKLALNDFKGSAAAAAAGGGGGDAALLRGSEHYHLPEARQSSLGMLHSPFWEPLPAEESNENSEIIDRHELRQQREALTACLDAKTRLHFSELEAIYKRLGNNETIQTPPNNQPPHVTSDLPTSVSDDEEEEASRSSKGARKAKKKKKKDSGGDRQLISPMAEFFEDLVKQVMDHQENLQKKFTEVMDRLNEERRAREEEWRNQEVAHFEREAAARAHEKAMAKSREAAIVSYLEKITGQRINLPPAEAASDHSNCGGGDDGEIDRDRNRGRGSRN